MCNLVFSTIFVEPMSAGIWDVKPALIFSIKKNKEEESNGGRVSQDTTLRILAKGSENTGIDSQILKFNFSVLIFLSQSREIIL